ncbi:MAG: thymidine kinase [Bacilli bacterium]|nr:thymidine kinase [Bacilli bacterium]
MAKMYFRFGAMNCGKTTALLQVAHNYEEKGMKIILIKPAVDKKGDKNVVSRLGIQRKVDILLDYDEKLKDILKLDNINCILVDEVQFMTKEQIKELWIIAKTKDIPVICYGLKTNFKGKLFEGSKAVIELADELEELITICKCGKRAKFNARVINGKYVKSGEEVAIDGLEASYEPLCGKCYIENVLKM